MMLLQRNPIVALLETHTPSRRGGKLAGVLQGMRQKACLSHKRTLLPKYNCISDKRFDTSPVQRSRRVKCPSQKPLREAKPAGPEGILLFGFPPKEVESVRTWLSGVNLKVVSGDGVVRKSSSVSEALELLASSTLPVERGEMLSCFTRVVLFSGLSGEEMEGLVDVWQDALGNGQISYGYVTTHMMEESVDRVLIKIISASDENDMGNLPTK